MNVLWVMIMGLLASPALVAGGRRTAAVEFSLALKQNTGAFDYDSAFTLDRTGAARDVHAAAGLAEAGDAVALASHASQEVEQKPMSVPERYLLELALESRNARRWGYVYLGVGGAMVAGGFALAAGGEDSDFSDDLFRAIVAVGLWSGGGACILGGVGTLIFASGPERKYAVVKSLPDPLHREQASREALHSLALSGRSKRFIAAGLFSAMAVYAMTGSSNPDGALLPGALAVYQLLRKSREENAYARFLAGGGAPSEGINLGFGPGPRGGFRLVLTASF